jgi:hypothetical protein
VLGFQFRERFAHFGNERGNDLIEEAALGAQLVAVTASATNDPAQHVTAAFVRRQHAISNQEAARTDVVGNDFQRRLIVVAATDGFGRSVSTGSWNRSMS